MKLRVKKNSVLISWLVSYASVLLIPIVISAVVYTQSEKIIEQEIRRANGIFLKQVQQLMDAKMMDIQRLSQIVWNSRLDVLLSVKGPFQSSQRYIITQIQKDLRVYKLANSFVEDFFIYFHNQNAIMTSNTTYSTELLKNTLNKTEKISYEQWEKLIRDYHVKKYLPLKINTERFEPVQAIAYVQSLPWTVQGDINAATLVILLNESQFMNSIENIPWPDNGFMFIIDKQDNIIASTDSDFPKGMLHFNDFAENDSGTEYLKLEQEEVAVSHITSAISDWKYVYVVPSSVFMQKVEYIKRLIWISIALCLVLGGIVSYLFARRNYSPISGIVKAIAEKAGIVLDRRLNEYNFINESINQTFKEKAAFEEFFKRQQSVLKTNFLTKLLKGRFDSDISVEGTLSSFDVHFHSDSFSILLFYIEDFSQMFESGNMTDPQGEERLKLVQFIVRNVMEELISKKHTAYMTEADGNILACIVNINTDEFNVHTQSIKDDLVLAANEAREFIKGNFKIKFTTSISSVHKTVAGIAAAYQEALEAMEYKMVVGNGHILCYEEIKKSHKSYDYTLSMEQKLINYIKTGDFISSSKIIDEVFDTNFSEEPLSIQMTKCLLFNLVSTMIKALSDISSVYTTSFLEKLNPVGRLLSSDTVMNTKHQMKNILMEVCTHIEDNKKSHNIELKEKIIDFIHFNYNDINLNVSAAAEHFGIHPNYLSQLFKEQIGMGLIEYINKIRIEKAKSFLVSSKISIADVAQNVGYSNSNVFIRAFKRYEGITPGIYRECQNSGCRL